jgi:hypothetical protein
LSKIRRLEQKMQKCIKNRLIIDDLKKIISYIDFAMLRWVHENTVGFSPISVYLLVPINSDFDCVE